VLMIQYTLCYRVDDSIHLMLPYPLVSVDDSIHLMLPYPLDDSIHLMLPYPLVSYVL